jgi:hypothetical protein
MATVVRSGLRLDRDRKPGRGDRHRVNVSPTLPRERVPKPPPLRRERGERTLDLVFRACTYTTATREFEPVPRIQPEPDRGNEQQRADQSGSRAEDKQPEQRGRHTAGRRLSGPGEPTELLAARVVQRAASSPIAIMPLIVAPASDVSAAPAPRGTLPGGGNDSRSARAIPGPAVRRYPCFVPSRREFVPSTRSRAHIHRYCRVSAPGNGIGAGSVGYGEGADLQVEIN